jgi:hypothetical protein
MGWSQQGATAPSLAQREEIIMSEGPGEVIEHLDAAVAAAERANMSASEIMGMLFYYAHNIAQRARETALENQDDA